MLVANTYDLWQKDTFFSAAEEVQQSADIMESAYRTWLRARKEGLIPQHLDELARELQMALGTAKWQLEEFEKAVRLSYRNHGNDITIARHEQFVSAIEDQISHVETALRESFTVEGKKPFSWVNLDQEECDDLALFLSGTSGTPQDVQDKVTTHGAAATSPLDKKKTNKQDSNIGSEISSKIRVMANQNSNCSGDETSYQTDKISNNRRTWSSSALEIVIDGDDKQKKGLIEATPKEKGSRLLVWCSKGEERLGARGVMSRAQLKLINWMNQHFRGGHRSQRQQQQVLPVLPANSMRFIFALMLTIFLVVPFLVYST